MIRTGAFCFTIAAASPLSAAIGHAEYVNVKSVGVVDLAPYHCTEVNRSLIIRRVCYDRSGQHMLISLDDIYYSYCGIPAGTVRAFLDAPSMGAFFFERIKGAFSCR